MADPQENVKKLQKKGRTEEARLFTELNDDNALDLLLRSYEEFLVSVEAGARWVVDELAMANEFSMAANLLRNAAIKSGTPWFYTHPILYLYRHTIELYLKAIVPSVKPTHNLIELRNALIEWAKSSYGQDISGSWVAQTITEFANIDPHSTRFRYVTDNHGRPSFKAEQVVNLDTLKTRLDALFLMLMQLAMAKRNGPQQTADPRAAGSNQKGKGEFRAEDLESR